MATKRKKKITYSQFLSWLEGVEDMQESEWSPDATQWKRIRDKLDSVIPDEVEIEVVSNVRPNFIPSMNNNAGVMPGLPTRSTLEDTPRPPVKNNNLPSAMQTSGAQHGELPKTITPNVDTSDGKYDSPLV